MQLSTNMKRRNAALKYGVVGAITTMSISAHAALPAWADGMFTTLTGYATDVLTATYTLAALVFGGFWLLTLSKKGASKAK
jgi:hypothetical protein